MQKLAGELISISVDQWLRDSGIQKISERVAQGLDEHLASLSLYARQPLDAQIVQLETEPLSH